MTELHMQKQELETGWRQERRSICHSMNKSHFIMRIHSIKSKRERVLMGRKETEDWGGKASCKQSMRQVLLMPLLPTPSFGEMDCIVFISLIPCVSLIINFYFSVCDSFPVSDIRILLIVPEREKTQIPITHWGYPLLPGWSIDSSLNGQDILPCSPLKAVQIPPGEKCLFHQP